MSERIEEAAAIKADMDETAKGFNADYIQILRDYTGGAGTG